MLLEMVSIIKANIYCPVSIKYTINGIRIHIIIVSAFGIFFNMIFAPFFIV